MTGEWPTTGPVDGPALAAAVGVEYVRRLAGGNAGAVLGRRDGREVVLTRWGPDQLAGWPALAPRLAALRSRGYPVPAMDVVPVPGGAVTVQERVDAVPAAHPTPGLVADLLRLVELQAGLGTGRLDLHLRADGPGFCLHGPLRAYSDRTRELLGWVEGVEPAGAGEDAVHVDLHLGNVLVRPGEPDRVAAVVDWAGCTLGDRRFDLVTLGFELTRYGEPETAVLDRLGRPPAAYVAHLALRLVDWSIRHSDAAEVDRWLAVADRWRTLAA